MNPKSGAPTSTPLEALRRVLSGDGASTQEELREKLEKMGLDITQSTVSRCLRKLGAVKTFNQKEESVYKLPGESIAPPVETDLADLVTSILHNDTLIVMRTAPGSASLIALHLDHFRPGGIIGTIAGDDTIFVAPPAKMGVTRVIDEIRKSIGKS